MEAIEPSVRLSSAAPGRLPTGANGAERLDPLFLEFLRRAAPERAEGLPPLREWVELAEAWRIVRALRECRGNRSAAARSLGIGRRTLYTKMEKLGLTERWDAPILEAKRP